MRQPLVPRSGFTALSRAVRRVGAAHHVPGPVGRGRTQPPRRGRRLVDALLEPHLIEARARPVGEQAHAVRSPQHLGDVVEPAQALVHRLPHRERGPHVQRPQLPVRTHQLDARHRRGQDPVPVPGAVGAGRARPRDGDVGQRAQVVQSEACRVQVAGELAEPLAGGHGDRAGRRVDLEPPGQRRDRDQVSRGVGDPVERVSGTERADAVASDDQLLQPRHRRGPVQAPRPEGDVAGPVGPGSIRCRGDHTAERTGDTVQATRSRQDGPGGTVSAHGLPWVQCPSR